MGLNMRVQGEILFILAFACKVFETTGNTTLSSTTLVPVEDVTVESDPPSAKLWEGEKLTLTCNVAKGNHLHYEWHFKTKTATVKLGNSNRTMTLDGVHENQTGSYYCVAKNILKEGQSQDIEVEVKVPVSNPKIWYSVHKQENNYSARITCKADRGSLPVTFTLLKNSRNFMDITRDLLNITFVVPVTLGQNLGDFKCQAENGKNPEHSDAKLLYVARVQDISLESRPHPLEVSVNEEMVFYCSVEGGTFLVYKWMFNGSSLQASLDSYSVNQQGNILTIPSAALVHNGFYGCSACDSFDETYCIKSASLQAKVRGTAMCSLSCLAVLSNLLEVTSPLEPINRNCTYDIGATKHLETYMKMFPSALKTQPRYLSHCDRVAIFCVVHQLLDT